VVVGQSTTITFNDAGKAYIAVYSPVINVMILSDRDGLITEIAQAENARREHEAKRNLMTNLLQQLNDTTTGKTNG
jgi:hypothetical protein